MLRHLTSRQVAEMEAYLRIEADPVGEETRGRAKEQRIRDRFLSMRGQSK